MPACSQKEQDYPVVSGGISLLSVLWGVEKLRSADRQCALVGGQAGLLSGTGGPRPEWVK